MLCKCTLCFINYVGRGGRAVVNITLLRGFLSFFKIWPVLAPRFICQCCAVSDFQLRIIYYNPLVYKQSES